MSLPAEAVTSRPDGEVLAGETVSTFGAYIRDLRQQAGLRISVMAERLGVTISHYARIERDEKAPPRSGRWDALLAIGASEQVLVAFVDRYDRTRLETRNRRRDACGSALAPGQPLSSTWDDLSWDDDDWCWYVVSRHPEGLSAEQVAHLIGVTPERVRQIEHEACTKLRTDPDALEMLQSPSAW